MLGKLSTLVRRFFVRNGSLTRLTAGCGVDLSEKRAFSKRSPRTSCVNGHSGRCMRLGTSHGRRRGTVKRYYIEPLEPGVGHEWFTPNSERSNARFQRMVRVGRITPMQAKPKFRSMQDYRNFRFKRWGLVVVRSE
jgi:hypothetical protein